jgi:hypothetical protein
MADGSPPTKSVRPTLSLNRVSPEQSSFWLGQWNDTLPGLWPGQWITRPSNMPTDSPSATNRSGGGIGFTGAFIPIIALRTTQTHTDTHTTAPAHTQQIDRPFISTPQSSRKRQRPSRTAIDRYSCMGRNL